MFWMTFGPPATPQKQLLLKKISDARIKKTVNSENLKRLVLERRHLKKRQLYKIKNITVFKAI